MCSGKRLTTGFVVKCQKVNRLWGKHEVADIRITQHFNKPMEKAPHCVGFFCLVAICYKIAALFVDILPSRNVSIWLLYWCAVVWIRSGLPFDSAHYFPWRNQMIMIIKIEEFKRCWDHCQIFSGIFSSKMLRKIMFLAILKV